MALIKCAECASDVSSLAATCPTCGFVKPPKKINWNAVSFSGVAETVVQLFFTALGGVAFLAGLAFSFSSVAYFSGMQNLLQETVAVNYAIAAFAAFCCTAICAVLVRSLNK